LASLWCVALDDSGDETRKDFLLAGSLFGNKLTWNTFNKSWRACLRADPSINYFHQKELTALNGEFLQFRDNERWPKPSGSQAANRKREALAQVIAQSTLKAHGLALSIPEYREVRDTAPNAKLFLDEDPWIYLLQEVVFDTARMIAEIDPNAEIAFLSDSSDKSLRYTKFYLGFKKKNPVMAKWMTGITHGEDERCYAIQAADLIAAEAKKCYDVIFDTRTGEPTVPLLEKFTAVATIPRDRIAGIIAKQAINRR
jgi:hypothetical protein